MSIAEGVMRSWEKEREEGYLALEAYMEMMQANHREACGTAAKIHHGTYWCARAEEEFCLFQDIEPDNSEKWPGWSQFIFVRDDILLTLGREVIHTNYPPRVAYDDQVGASVPDVVVVGTHTSKRVTLPVMQFKWREMLVTCRNNFHDWKVSVQVPLGLDPTEDLLDIACAEDHLLHPVYFEGFPKAYIYPSLKDGQYPLTGQFSTMFGAGPIGHHMMWTFFWLLKRWYEGRFGPPAT